MTTSFTIHGARGSFSVWGPAHQRYSGDTSCFSLETERGLLIIDAGSGLRHLGSVLSARPALPPMTMLFTHFHWDHLLGLLAFGPLFSRDTRLTVMADPVTFGDWPSALRDLVRAPWWPVDVWSAGASVTFTHLPGGKDPMAVRDPLELAGVRVSWCPIWHPQGGISYRFETPEGTLVLATDREAGHPELESRFVEFCRGADVLLHDAQYLPDELPRYRSRGHSTWEQAARLAADIGVKSLVLVSHDPARTDDEIDRLTAQARRIFPNTTAATAPMTLTNFSAAAVGGRR